MPRVYAHRDVVGQTFNRLTVLRQWRDGKHWRAGCRCACGNTKEIRLSAVIAGSTKSCGCLDNELQAYRGSFNRKYDDERNRLYGAWLKMIDRCENPRNIGYGRYGARGISVCERWHTFDHFLADMGRPPTPKHQIDRRDTNGNYEPANCRWVTATQQARNTRANRLVTWRGETLCLAEWGERLGFSGRIIGERLREGWDVERAMTTQPRSLIGAQK